VSGRQRSPRLLRALALLPAAVACTDINQDDLLAHDTGPADTGGTYTPPETTDDRLLILNGKLSSKAAGYTLNEQGGDGRWIGSDVYAWEPATPGALTRLGWLDLGPDDPDHDLEAMSAREIAAAEDGTLWLIMGDQGTNDEWILGRVADYDPAARDQPLPVTMYVVNPADTNLYETLDLTGAGLRPDGTLVLGSPPDGLFPGAWFEIGCLPPAWEDSKDRYYAQPGCDADPQAFADDLGIAGDVAHVDGRDLALITSGTDFTTNTLWDLAEGAVGEGVEVDPTEPLTGLALVGDQLFAVGIEGDVYAVDPATGAFSVADDLRALLPEDDLGQSTRRLRGAATLAPTAGAP